MIAHPDQHEPAVLPSKLVPDPDVLNALMLTMISGVWTPCDERKLSLGFRGDATLEGCIHREPYHFYPPRRIVEPEKVTSLTKTFLTRIADLLLFKAQKRFYTDEMLASLNAKYGMLGIRNIYIGYAIQDKSQNLYFDIDTSYPTESQKLVQQIQALVDEVKNGIRAALQEVMQNGQTMREVIKTAEVEEKITAEVVLKDIIAIVDHVRNQIEAPEDQKQFLQILNQAVRLLGIDDVDVELLSSRDAVVYGAQGLYRPQIFTDDTGWGRIGKTKIAIPMSRYGTTELSDWDEILETLAHELAHYVIDKSYERLQQLQIKLEDRRLEVKLPGIIDFSIPLSRADQDHNLAHTMCAQKILKRLREFEYGLDTVMKPIAPETQPQLALTDEVKEYIRGAAWAAAKKAVGQFGGKAFPPKEPEKS